jgi:hypothetical protein
MIFYDILYEDFPRVFPSSPFAQDLAAKLFSQNGCRLIGLFFDHRIMVSFYIPEHPKISQSYFFQKDILVGSGWWFGTWLEKFSHHIGNNTPN